MMFSAIKFVVALVMLALAVIHKLQSYRAKLPQDYRHAQVLGDLWLIGAIIVMVLA